MAKIQVALLGRSTTRITGRDGKFHFSQLPAGSYVLQVSGVGYRSFQIFFQLESPEEAKEFAISLAPENFRRTERVEVSGDVLEPKDWPPDLPVTSAMTMEAVIADSLGDYRIYLQLLGAFAAVASLLQKYGHRAVHAVCNGKPKPTTAIKGANRNGIGSLPDGDRRVCRRRESAIAIAQQNRDVVAAVGRHGQIELSISGEVVQGNRNWLRAHRIGRSGLCERAIAISQQNGNRIDGWVCGGEIQFPVAIQIAGDECVRADGNRRARRLRKASAAITEQDSYAVCSDCQIELAVTVDIRTIHNIGEQDAEAFLAMEFLQSATLKHRHQGRWTECILAVAGKPKKAHGKFRSFHARRGSLETASFR